MSLFRESKSDPNAAGKHKPPKPKNLPQVSKFQFFPARLYELIDKEVYFHQQSIGYRPVAPADESPKKQDKFLKEEQKKIDKAQPLTEAELRERDQLLTQGFHDWSKRDFAAFLKAADRYGRDDLPNIAKEVDKPVERVKEYSEVFWARYTEIPNYEKLLKIIERGEQRNKKQKETRLALELKYKMYTYPHHQMQLSYSGQRSKNFTEEEDR